MERLTERELKAVAVALARALADEPETDDEDTEGMELVAAKVARLFSLRARWKKQIRTT